MDLTGSGVKNLCNSVCDVSKVLLTVYEIHINWRLVVGIKINAWVLLEEILRMKETDISTSYVRPLYL